MGGTYYNEIDSFCVAWLRELIKQGHLSDGIVDDRDIRDVPPADLVGFTRCHFFAGIGGWDYALQLAGWDPATPVWTGSCPCQPFSAAGKGAGFADERHLWPSFHYLIEQCRPPVVFGEQVAKALAWLDLVYADLEGTGYTCGAVDLGAPSAGAFHIRQRLWWVAESGSQSTGWGLSRSGAGPSPDREGPPDQPERSGGVGQRVAHPAGQRRAREHALLWEGTGRGGGTGATFEAAGGGTAVSMGLPPSRRRERLGDQPAHREPLSANPWARADWLPCADGKSRPVEPGTFPLAHGVSARVGRLRGYGNAIVPQVAAEVIRAYMEARGLA